MFHKILTGLVCMVRPYINLYTAAKIHVQVLVSKSKFTSLDNNIFVILYQYRSNQAKRTSRDYF